MSDGSAAAVAKPVLRKLGGSYHLVVERPEDLEHIQGLDDALWISTSLPVEGLECDAAFLKYMDLDGNRRIRSFEVREAQRWLFRMLRDRSRLAERTPVLRLDAIDVSHGEGRALRAAAELILSNLDLPDAAEISLSQVRDRQRVMGVTAANGDGVIPPEAADGPEVAALIADIMDTVGSVKDVAGKPGVNAELLGTFRKQAGEYLAWLERRAEPGLLVWGERTHEAYCAAAPLWGKLDEFFALSALVRFDPRAADRYGLSEEELKNLPGTPSAAVEERLRAAPLARPSADEALPLDGGANPCYRDALEALARGVLPRLEDGEGAGGGNGSARRLTRTDWRRIRTTLAPYREWQEAKVRFAVEKLGAEKLRGYLAGPLFGEVERLIGEDLAVAGDVAQMQSLEKLVLYHQWFLEFVNNSVSFPRLYDPARRSMAEAGTLVMDGRAFTLAVKVLDRPAHRKVAEQSHTCMLYLEVTGRESAERFEAAAAVTSGSMARLYVGKLGVFYTPDGREWDARVVDMIQNPVDLWEAIKEPFKRLGEFIGRQFEKVTSSYYSDVESKVGQGMSALHQVPAAPAPAAAAPAAGGGKTGAIRDLLLSGSVAVAALGSSFAYITSALSKPGFKLWSIVVVVGGLVLLLFVPAAIMGIVKLRRRNIGAMLEACGWAMNARMRLTSRLGRLFSRVPPAPEGTVRQSHDMASVFMKSVPRAGRRWLRWTIGIALAVALGALAGFLVLDRVVRPWMRPPVRTETSAAEPKDGKQPEAKPGPVPAEGKPVAPPPSGG